MATGEHDPYRGPIAEGASGIVLTFAGVFVVPVNPLVGGGMIAGGLLTMIDSARRSDSVARRIGDLPPRKARRTS